MEARKSIGSYIETKPYNSFELSSNGLGGKIVTAAAAAVANGDAQSDHSSSTTATGEGINQYGAYEAAMMAAAGGVGVVGGGGGGGGGDRKYKCSLCTRTSRWQWDVKKHIRTVHKDQHGDVLVIECTKSMSDTAIRPPPSNGSGSSNYASSSTSSIVSQHHHRPNNHHNHHHHPNSFQNQFHPSPNHYG